MPTFTKSLSLFARIKWFAVLLSLIFATIAFSSLNEIVLAQGAFEQAIGTKGFEIVRGMQASVWTAQPPLSLTSFRASPVGICTAGPPCPGNAGWVETGYYKGIATQNVLTQYASWKSPNGVKDAELQLANLNNDTWHQFAVLWKGAQTQKWLVKRDGIQILQIVRNPPNFNSGIMAACGAEGGENNINIAVQCNSMAARVGGAWVLFDWDVAQTTPGYCVNRPFQFGALGWGPGC